MRELKGKSLIDFPDTYAVVDIETSGLDPSYDNIIEIGAIIISNNNILNTFNSLIRPNSFQYINDESFQKDFCIVNGKKVYYIDDFIVELTGITNQMLSTAPTIENVLPEFLSFIDNYTIIGHNINFDINFLYDNCIEILNRPVTNDFIDTMRLARKLFPELRHHRLCDMADHLLIECKNMHRSINDCEITLACFCKYKSIVLEKYISVDKFQFLFLHNKTKLDARTLSTSNTDFDTSHALYGKICVFTGTLEKMIRKEAMQLVIDLGGLCENNVTSETNFLILGNNDYCSTIKDGKSTKQKKAEKLKLKCNDIEIISENVFYDLVEVC